jgi:hypothetical protein
VDRVAETIGRVEVECLVNTFKVKQNKRQVKTPRKTKVI